MNSSVYKNHKPNKNNTKPPNQTKKLLTNQNPSPSHPPKKACMNCFVVKYLTLPIVSKPQSLPYPSFTHRIFGC